MSISFRKRRAGKRERAERQEHGRIKRAKPGFSALGLPEDVVTGQARLTLMGDRRVLVENHQGIVEITGACVRVMTRGGILSVRGEGLELGEACQGALSVEGGIHSVELPGCPAKEAPHA